MHPGSASPLEAISFHFQDVVISTMAVARQWIREGVEKPFACVAKRQSGGYGRHGRSFQSPDGGLWMTLALPWPDAALVPAAGFRAGVAIAHTLEDILRERGPSPPELRIKWPNDLLIDERKVCGVLGEVHAARGREWLLIGVGMNVNNDPNLLASLRRPAASLREWTRRFVEIEPLARLIAARVHDAVERDLSRDAVEWAAAHLWRLDQPVTMQGRDGTRSTAMLRGLTPRGELIVDRGGGPTPLPAGCELADESPSRDPRPAGG
jgi:BirA family biotin operon repressor/biotin-[acetyl-CoA-carboxylase] ligase